MEPFDEARHRQEKRLYIAAGQRAYSEIGDGVFVLANAEASERLTVLALDAPAI